MTTKVTHPNPKPPIPFGVLVSRDYPSFEIGGLTFKTRLLSMNEEREIVRQSDRMNTVASLADVSASELSQEDQDETFRVMAQTLLFLLRSRLTEGDPEELTEAWLYDNITTTDFPRILYFLRKGSPQPEDMEVDDLGEDDPNAVS